MELTNNKNAPQSIPYTIKVLVVLVVLVVSGIKGFLLASLKSFNLGVLL